jgi:hypothetical protein
MAYAAAMAAVYKSLADRKQAQQQAGFSREEGNLSVNQANQAEGQLRRQNMQRFGAQSAAFGASGVGYGGSSETALSQSAVNEEMDALNTRYKGSLTGWGYNAQAGLDEQQGRGDLAQIGLLAGGQALKYANLGQSYAGGGVGAGN